MRKPILALMFFLATTAIFAAAQAHSIYDFTIKSIDGQPVSLKSYDGKVVMLVNVASKCGFTPQYAGLEALYEKYKDRGFVIVGVPANNFAQQEPGTNEEIKKFCTQQVQRDLPDDGQGLGAGRRQDAALPLPHRQVREPAVRAATSSGTSPSSSSTATASPWRGLSRRSLPIRPRFKPPSNPLSANEHGDP